MTTACEVEDAVAKEGTKNEPLPVTIMSLPKEVITESKSARLYRQVRALCSTRQLLALMVTFEIHQIIRRKTECFALKTVISSSVKNNTAMNMINADTMQISLQDPYIIFPRHIS